MNIILLDETDSTNSWGKANIDKLKDGDIVVAKVQTAGRGRLDKVWASDNEQNLYMSFILKPDGDFSQLPLANLTQYLSVVAAKVIENYEPQAKISAQIKWPNDILVNNKKIAGILAEMSTQGKTLNGIVLGIGLNLNMSEDELKKIDKPATSLNLEVKHQVEPSEILAQIRREFFSNYEDFLETGFQFIKKDYINRANFLDKKICVESLGQKICGVVKSLNHKGELVLVDDKNIEKTIIAGDILW